MGWWALRVCRGCGEPGVATYYRGHMGPYDRLSGFSRDLVGLWLWPGEGWNAGGATPVWNARMCVFRIWNVPILLREKNIPILKGSSAHFIPRLWCNIKLKFIVHKGHSQSLTFWLFGIVYVDCSLFSPFFQVINIIHNTQHKFLPILSDVANSTLILSEIFSLVSLPYSLKRTHVLHFWTHIRA